jgi:hypothetical protein
MAAENFAGFGHFKSFCGGLFGFEFRHFKRVSGVNSINGVNGRFYR